jgi:NB-ARC domain
MDPLSLAAIGWSVSAASWLISPVLSRFLNKGFDALGSDSIFQSRKEALAKKVEHLQATLLPQLIILTDAAEKNPHRRELEGWLQKLKSAYYEAEHWLGLVEYKQLEEKANSLYPPTSKSFFTKFIKLDKHALKLNKNDLDKSLKTLEKVVDKANKFLKDLPTKSVSSSTSRSSDQSKETISTPVFEVVGRDRDLDQIVQLLLEDIPESTNNAMSYSVIGIWGMGGSGKTTLAQYVSKHVKEVHLNTDDVEGKYFDLVVWAYVSQNFSVKSIFKRIWESAFEEPCPNFESIEGLCSKLKEKLNKKRFLLVLDDVWLDQEGNHLQLQQLFAPLQVGKRGSKILVTTRFEGVAKALGVMNPIQLRQLDHDEFLRLLMTHALRDMNDAEKHLEGRLKQIGEQIAKKLSQSPLAATIVAAQLRTSLDPDFWSSMLNKNLLKETMGALLLSYQNLSPALQRCFAFCSLFPKGYPLDHDYLISLWIAEGYIEKEENSEQHERDIANGYLSELISSAFLEVYDKLLDNTRYRLHDLLHDLAEQVSRGECFTIERHEKREIPTQTRHLFVEAFMFEKYVRKICNLKDLRTIIFSSKSRITLNEEDLNALFKSSKFWVVDLYYNEIKRLPKSVIYLKNLRYLRCGYVQAKEPPKSLSRLYQLRALLSPSFRQLPIPEVGRLLLIQELSEFHVGTEKGYELEQLEHLGELSGYLEITNLKTAKSSQEACRAKLSDKRGLDALLLCWGNSSWSDYQDDVGGREADILDALRPPHQLQELYITGYNGKRSPCWISEYNTHLKELSLRNCPFLEDLPEINNLTHLQSLTIIRSKRLKRWASLPSCLAELTLRYCDSLAFGSEEELKMRESTRSEDQSPINTELRKKYQFDEKMRQLDRICQLKEVNRELHLPHTLQTLDICQCFIADKILASSLQGHTKLTQLKLSRIIPITKIPKEVLSSLTSLRVLSIEGCLMLTSVCGLDALLSLTDLEMLDCPRLTIEMPIVARNNFLNCLRIRSCRPPKNILQDLVSVQQLFIENCPTIESPDFSRSKSLHYLSVKNCENLVSLWGLNELNNLKILSVCGCDRLQCSSCVGKPPSVESLDITELSTLQLISRNKLSDLSLINLSRQEYTQKKWYEMLSPLCSLENISFVDVVMPSLPNLSYLRSLKHLRISRCSNLTSLSDLPPSLKGLEIICCENLTSLPELPPSVESITIENCNYEFTRSCKDASHPNGQKFFLIPIRYIR